MCGTLWGVAASAGCAYLAYVAYSRFSEGDYRWQHEWWSMLTWGIWIVFIVAMFSETRCWREWIVFALLMLNSTLGFVLAAWKAVPTGTAGQARELSMILWALAAVASLVTLRRTELNGPAEPKDTNQEPGAPA
jgi:hypothetical protein